ncbi:MAG: phospholipase D-like domain-containing protein [Tannerella sp.]|jgi:superfamily II DNA or RNA helicase|nr:phospholipase D-like domain-containing protein [Tannerella sp.]
MNNTLIDNSTVMLSMCETVKQCFREHDIREVKIASGYWDLPGMALIFDELNDFLKSENTKLQLLIGEDPCIRIYQQLSPAIKNPKFPEDYIKKDINDLELKEEYQKVVNLLLTYCDHAEDEKIEIRIFRKNENEETQFLHSKCYIFIGENAYGIIGSSNFTKKGLEDNAELNYLETNGLLVAGPGYKNYKTHLQWFNEKWEQSQHWNKIFLEEILRISPIGKITERERENIKPYEVYIRFLQNLWADIVDNKFGNMLESFLPPEIQKLQYQFDAVNQGYNIMKRHNGFILADVVGLGKTMVGIMVVKRFIEDTYTDGRSRNVLIVTPPAVKKAWMETIALFDRDKDNGVGNYITFITTGSIGQLTEETEDIENIDGENIDAEHIEVNKQFGLILIDESHKFRNSTTQMYKTMDELIGRIYPNPYIVLLSATPQNNSPQDLKNQIFLFQREHQNTTLEKIEGRKLDSFFVEKEKRFQELKKNSVINNNALIELSNEIREKVLDDLLVRRTRTDIKKYYENDADGLKFPEIKGPYALEYKMDNELAQLFAETMDIIAPYDTDKNGFLFSETGLKYYRYRAIEFLLKPEHKDLYQKRNLTTESTSQLLAGIMQILLVKRLESSFSAFKTSLHNLQRYTQNMLDMLQDDVVFICPDIKVNDELDTETNNRSKQECYEVIRQKIKKKGENNREFRSADFSQTYADGLKADKDIIDKLCKRWDKTTFDPKLRKFLKVLDNELFNPELNNPSGLDPQKLVIFTEAIDTVKELKREIEGGGDVHKVLAITAANRNEMQNAIKANFDANAIEKSDEYDIIITTEVLAEGVNLHRSNVIVNYDTPWNSTRLMQRIGRVNRIGSKEKFIHVFNFMPTAQGDAQIGLVQKAHAKLQTFHALFGEDSKIFSEAEDVDSYGKNPDALRNLIDGEESAYEKYIAELKAFKANYPSEYRRIASLPLPLFCAKKSNAEETVCVVKMPEGKGLYLCVGADGVKDISTLEMIEKIQCSPDTPSLKLPENVALINKKAIDECKIFFDKMHTAKDSTKIRTAALGVIAEWRKQNLSNESKQLLTTADRLVRNGYAVLSKKIINLNKLLENNDQSLFKPGEYDYNALILNELSALKLHKTNKAKAEPIITLSITNRL